MPKILGSQIDHLAHLATSLCFITSLIIDGVGWFFAYNPMKIQVFQRVLFINFVASITHCFQFFDTQNKLVINSVVNRPIYVTTFVEWLYASTMMILLIEEMDITDQMKTAKVTIAQAGCIIFGFFYGLPFGEKWYWLNFLLLCGSFLCFFYVIVKLRILFGIVRDSLFDDDSKRTITMLQKVTIFMWSLFPLVAMLGILNIIPIWVEIVANKFADLIAKLLYAILLLHSNFLVEDYVALAEYLQREREYFSSAEYGKGLRFLKQLFHLACNQQHDITKESYFGKVSHQLRTPLNSVITFSKEFWRTASTQEQRNNANMVMFNSQQLLETIENILEFINLERAVVVSLEKNFEIPELLDRVYEAIGDRVYNKNFNVIVKMDDICKRNCLNGDEKSIYGVIFHLVRAGIHFAYDKSTMVVETEIETIGNSPPALCMQFRTIGQTFIPQNILQTIETPQIPIEHELSSVKLALKYIERTKGTLKVKAVGSTTIWQVKISVNPTQDTTKFYTQRETLPAHKVCILTQEPLLSNLVKDLCTHWGMKVIMCDSIEQANAKMQSCTDIITEYKFLKQLPQKRIKSKNVILLSSMQNFLEAEDNTLCLLKPVVSDILYRKLAIPKIARRREVLVVDDNNINRVVAAHVLTSLGCLVDTADNGKSALEKLQAGRYSLILMVSWGISRFTKLGSKYANNGWI